jgi:hypothetical protein
MLISFGSNQLLNAVSEHVTVVRQDNINTRVKRF